MSAIGSEIRRRNSGGSRGSSKGSDINSLIEAMSSSHMAPNTSTSPANSSQGSSSRVRRHRAQVEGEVAIADASTPLRAVKIPPPMSPSLEHSQAFVMSPLHQEQTGTQARIESIPSPGAHSGDSTPVPARKSSLSGPRSSFKQVVREDGAVESEHPIPALRVLVVEVRQRGHQTVTLQELTSPLHSGRTNQSDDPRETIAQGRS